MLIFIFWAMVAFTHPQIESDVDEWNKALAAYGSVFNFENLPTVQLKIETPNDLQKQECDPFLRVDENLEYDCASRCNDPNYGYQYINSENVVVNNELLEPGGYCMKKHNCHPSTSIAVYTANDWQCIAKTNEFSATGQIYVCDGVLRDNLTKMTYTDYLPPALLFNNVDETFIEDGNVVQRFQCQNTFDDMNNAKINTP